MFIYWEIWGRVSGVPRLKVVPKVLNILVNLDTEAFKYEPL